MAAPNAPQSISLQGPVFFASDLHLNHPGLRPSRRDAHCAGADRDILLSVLRTARNGHGTLFLLGDLFAYWYEKPGFFFFFFKTYLSDLKTFTDRGCRVYAVRGNRDFLLGPVFEEATGVSLFAGPLKLSTDRMRIGLDHGDGLLLSLWNSRFMRRFLRSRYTRRAALLLPSVLMTELGYAYSVFRKYAAFRQQETTIDLRLLPGSSFSDCDALIMGHVHRNQRLRYRGPGPQCPLYTVGGVREERCLLRAAENRIEFQEICRP